MRLTLGLASLLMVVSCASRTIDKTSEPKVQTKSGKEKKEEPPTLQEEEFNKSIKRLHVNDLKDFYKAVDSENLPKQLPPVFFIIEDTLRRDYVTEKNAPAITKFEQENFSFSGLSGSTSTAHGFFSIFWNMLPHLRVNLINPIYKEEDGFEADDFSYLKGSPYLYILRKAGYQIHLFSWEDTGYCPNKTTWSPFADLQIAHLQILYSQRPDYFLTYCLPKKDVQKKVINFGVLDQGLLDRLLFNLENKKDLDGNFYIIHFQGVHHPYGWTSKKFMGSYVKEHPFEWLHPSKTTWQWGEKDKSDELSLKNSYSNAVRSADFMFWKIISQLKARQVYDKSMVVFMSDHGHALLDSIVPPNSNGHGYEPFENQIEVPFAVKVPEGVRPAIEKMNLAERQATSSVFSLLFSALGYDPKSLLSKLPVLHPAKKDQPYCFVSFKPEYDMPIGNRPPKELEEFSFQNDEEKIFFRFDNSKIFYAKKIIPYRWTDLKDQGIEKSFDESKMKEYLKTHFASCLAQMFEGDFDQLLMSSYPPSQSI